ncbi:unnamed protein product, partial [Polarella glacialis]
TSTATQQASELATALASDDSCRREGADDSECALSALQLNEQKRAQRAAVVGERLEADPHKCAGKELAHACLCVFDIDRTLSGKQGVTDPTCPDNSVQKGIYDDAYDRGTFTLSALAAECGSCYLGLCSHGIANHQNSAERFDLLGPSLNSEPHTSLRLTMADMAWSDDKPSSPYMVGVQDGKKQFAVMSLSAARSGKLLACTGMNARQVSCQSRDGSIGHGQVGLCGATPAEIVKEKGSKACKIDCVWTDWTSWSSCSASCGEGVRHRARRVWVPASNGGHQCPPGQAKDTEECLLKECPTTTTTTTTTLESITTAEEVGSPEFYLPR